MADERFEPVTIGNVIVLKETDKAILCRFHDDCEEWIPKSQILAESEVHSLESSEYEPGDLVIPRWLAEEKGVD